MAAVESNLDDTIFLNDIAKQQFLLQANKLIGFTTSKSDIRDPLLRSDHKDGMTVLKRDEV